MKLPKLALPLCMTLLYLLVGGLWILLSDQLLSQFLYTSPQHMIYHTFKGWAFVLVSGLLLYILLMKDLTGRKQAEKALYANEQLYRLITQNSQDLIWTMSLDFQLTYVSPMVEWALGYSAGEILSSPPSRFLMPQSYAAGLNVFKEEIQKARPEPDPNYVRVLELEYRRRDGSTFWAETKFSFFRDQNEKPMGVLGVGRDVTKRKQTDQEIQSRSRQLTALLEASQSLTESLNLAEVLQKITDKAANVLETEASALYLVNGQDLYLAAATPLLHPSFPESFRTAALADHPHIAEALSTGQPVLLADAVSASLSAAEQAIREAMGLRTILYVPVVSQKDAKGVLILGTTGTPKALSRNDRDLASGLANQAALAISNAMLYEDQVRQVQELGTQIAEREQVQAALYESEERLRLSLQAANQGLYDLNVQTGDAIVNRQYAEMLGYEFETFQETNAAWIERLHPDDQASVANVYAEYVAGRLPEYRVEFRQKTKDGQWKWILSLGKVIEYDSDGKPLRMLGTHTDITERRRAEEQIRRQLRHLNALRLIDIAISSSFDLHVILDVVLQQALSQLGVDASAVLLVNPALQTIEYAASRGFRSSVLSDIRLKLIEGYAGRAVLQRKTIHIPGLMETGSKLAKTLQAANEGFVDYYGVPLMVKGDVKGVLEIYHRSHLKADTEWLEFLEALAGQAAIAIDNAQLFENLQRMNANLEQRIVQRTAELQQANAELEHANRAKDEFLANMSHELRTPLTSILGLSESLLEQRRDPLTERQCRSLEVIGSSGQHLLELINDILDLSKIEAGKFDYYPQPVSVDEICRSSLSFVKSQATKKSIRVTYILEPGVSRILADPRRLKQILVNLLTNAVKFTSANGEVTLRVDPEPEQDLIRFSVIDTGIGIAPEDLRRLFQPFVQVDSSLNRQHEGTGLGLALVRRLTDLHGGSVQVESQVGKGSRFTINLPCLQEEVARLEKPNSRAPASMHPSSEDNPGGTLAAKSRGTVLLADDSMPNILTIGEYLENHGYSILVAHDGLEAVKRAGDKAPDIILMDIQMPVMNGLEAIARLRADIRFVQTPMIALTALAMPGDREHCLLSGADEYMSKPVSLKALFQTMERLLQRQ